MATAHRTAAPQAAPRSVAADNRGRAFRDAVRHSGRVRMLRWLCPALAVAAASVYVIPSQLTFKVAGGEATVKAVDVSSGDLKMINPRVKGENKSQGRYDVRADYATQSLTNPDTITMEKIEGDVIAGTGEKTTLSAPGGVYNSKTEEMNFNRGVDIERSNGLKAKLKSAMVYFSKNLVVSKEPVEVRMHDSLIRAQSLELFTNESRAIFTGKVFVHLERQAPEAAANPAPGQ